jgi:hypothetical protein
MLYVGKCKDCGYIVQNQDVSTFKDSMAKHRNDSHKEFWVFVKKIALHDFDCFSILRFSYKETATTLERVMNNVGFWKAIRKYPTLQNIPFSGLGDREKTAF